MKTWKDENGNEIAVDAERAPGLVWLRVRDTRSAMALAVRLAPDAARELAAEILTSSHRGAAKQADKLDAALAHQQQLNAIAEAGDDQPPEGYTIDFIDGPGYVWSGLAGVCQAEPPCSREEALRLARLDDKHRRAIATMIELFEEHDRIELLVEHGGGLVPALLLHEDCFHNDGQQFPDVVLCLEVEVPALRGSGDRDPVATGEDEIVAWAGDHGYADLNAWKAGDSFPLRLAVQLLEEESLLDS